jgi:hypothetical protein
MFVCFFINTQMTIIKTINSDTFFWHAMLLFLRAYRWRHDTQHSDTQHNDTQHKLCNLSILCCLEEYLPPIKFKHISKTRFHVALVSLSKEQVKVWWLSYHREAYLSHGQTLADRTSPGPSFQV